MSDGTCASRWTTGAMAGISLPRITFNGIVVWLFGLSFAVTCCAGQYECTENGHRVLSNPFRSDEFTASSLNDLLCDVTLDRGWYRMEIFGKPAEMPTRCVKMDRCGTSAPIWLNTEGENLPAPGESGRYRGCTAWQIGPSVSGDECCYFSFPLTVTNCGDFFVYYLTPTRGCFMAYCSTVARRKCGDGEVSPDGFAPCKRIYPLIVGIPEVLPVVYLDQPHLKCDYTVGEATNATALNLVTWYKAERSSDMFQAVNTENTSGNQVLIPLNEFRMGEKVLCTVQSFFNNTREMSPPVESNSFHISIQVSPRTLNIPENGERHLLSFESTIPLRCPADDPECQIKIPLTVLTAGKTSDITLSDCSLSLVPQMCSRSEQRCQQAFVYTLAIVDFVTDNGRLSTIKTQPIRSPDPFWDGYDPEDIQVTVTDVPGGYCYSFTDPHFITFDKKKYSFFKTGTFVMFKSLAREFEVHSRFWECGDAAYPVSCNCGFVVREDNDIISIDMCHGEPYNTEADIRILGNQPLTDGIKILEARDGKKLTIEFLSGAYVRADVADWGISITLRVPSVDYGSTLGLCGTFDDNPSNDFHDNLNNMMVDLGDTEPVEFVENWRLSDGGMFNIQPSSNPFGFRLPSCFCRKEGAYNEEAPLSSLLCPDGGCDISCGKYEYAQSTPLIQSKDISRRFRSSGFVDFGPISLVEADGAVVNTQFGRDGVNAESFNLPAGKGNGYGAPSQANGKRRFHLEFPVDNDHATMSKRSSLGFRQNREQHTRAKHQIEGLDRGAITDFFTLLDLDFPMFEMPTGLQVSNLVETYPFPPDDKTPDLLPLVIGWPTLSGITEEQARGICEMTLQQSTLGRACGEGGSPEVVAEAVEVCVSDIQLTDDPSWRFETTPLLENLCEAAAERLGMNDTYARHVRSALNCPGNCSGNGNCTELGCECSDGFEGVDCSQEIGVPILMHIEKNGLCDIRESPCDHIKLIVTGIVASATVDCVFSNPRVMHLKEEASDLLISVPGQVVNKRTVACPVGRLADSITPLTQSSSFRQWDVQISQDGQLSRTNLTLTMYDSLCVHCDWRHECLIRNSSCFIEGICYSSESNHPDNACLACLPNINAQRWSKLAGGRPPVVGLPNRRYALVDKEVLISLDDVDTKGHSLDYTTDFKGVSITREGALSWTPPTTGYFQIPVDVTDVCDGKSELTLEFDVLACGCRNGGTCILDPAGTTECSCPEFYGGTLCERSPLRCPGCDHGTCILDNDVKRCSCHAGFTGSTCSTVIDPCASAPCYPGVRCDVIDLNSFSCGSCPQYMIGDGQTCTSKTTGNLCIPGCMNGGWCTKRNTCICKRGYFGNRCESSNCGLDCMNGGYCSGLQRCDCVEGYTGMTCEIPTCAPPCRNGGSCIKPGVCSCLKGYHGSNCQHAICSRRCHNGGSCVRRNDCACAPGYTGNTCRKPVCHPTCMNGGQCVAPDRCLCPSGYTGRKCQKAICVAACQNGGVCVRPNVCSCKNGYTGSTCQKAACNRPCMYGGRCVDHNRCQCRHGRRGHFCEKPPKRKRKTRYRT